MRLVRLEGFGAHIVLDALRVDARRLRADAERAEEAFDDVMPFTAALGKFIALGRQENPAIGLLLDEPLGGKTLEHLGDGRLRDTERAIDAYQQALQYRTPQTAPLDYAMTQANLGIAYEHSENLPAAIACWREAEKYFRQMGYIEDADLMLRWIARAEGGGDSAS